MIVSQEHQKILLDLASTSIKEGLEKNQPKEIALNNYPKELRSEYASFVTLHLNNKLRGCIGTLEANDPLACNVCHNAFHAAFKDPRFPPLTLEEFSKIDIEISVLNQPHAISFQSEEDLLSKIRPETDGLILEEGYQRATFLPSVWKHLKTPKDFLNHLKKKAGLPETYWSDSIKISRYQTETFGKTD